MTSSITKATLRQLFPRSKLPVARNVADMANSMRSARLVEAAHAVRLIEIDALALDAMMTEAHNGS